MEQPHQQVGRMHRRADQFQLFHCIQQQIGAGPVFLLRAGQYGLAFSAMNPRLRELLRSEPANSVSQEDLDRGLLTAPIRTDLYSGLRE